MSIKGSPGKSKSLYMGSCNGGRDFPKRRSHSYDPAYIACALFKVTWAESFGGERYFMWCIPLE